MRQKKVYIDRSNATLQQEEGAIQGQFLYGIYLSWIQCFASPTPITEKSPVYRTIYP